MATVFVGKHLSADSAATCATPQIYKNFALKCLLPVLRGATVGRPGRERLFFEGMLRIRKLRRLSLGECWLLAQATALLPAVRMALKLAPFARLQLLAARGMRDKRQRAHAAPSLDTVIAEASNHSVASQSTARIVRIAAERGLYRAKCLEQSLVLYWLLQRQGIDSRILFGARKEGEQIQAHAWVEVDGIAVCEEDDLHERFSAFTEVITANTN